MLIICVICGSEICVGAEGDGGAIVAGYDEDVVAVGELDGGRGGVGGLVNEYHRRGAFFFKFFNEEFGAASVDHGVDYELRRAQDYTGEYHFLSRRFGLVGFCGAEYVAAFVSTVGRGIWQEN